MISLAFDDLLLETVETVPAVLAEQGFTATFAVAPALCGTVQWGVRVAEMSQLTAIQAAGHEIASHGLTHRPLPSLSDEELEIELAKSREVLEAATLCYPGSKQDARVRTAAARHYRQARTVVPSPALALIDPQRLSPEERYLLPAYAPSSNEDPATVVRTCLDVPEGLWLIVVFHLIGENPLYPYTMSPEGFRHVCESLAQAGTRIVPIGEALPP